MKTVLMKFIFKNIKYIGIYLLTSTSIAVLQVLTLGYLMDMLCSEGCVIFLHHIMMLLSVMLGMKITNYVREDDIKKGIYKK